MEPIHLRHFYDGYPLCWSYDQDGEFEGSYKDEDVTCPACREHMKLDPKLIKEEE